MLDKKQIEKLMWQYAKETNTDNIIGLHVCDNFRKWLAKKILEVYYL